MAFRLSLLQKGLLFLSVPLCVQVVLTAALANLHAEAEAEARRAAHAREVSDSVNQLVKDIYEIMTVAMNANKAEVWHDPKLIAAGDLLRKQIYDLKELVKDDRRQSDLVADMMRGGELTVLLLRRAQGLYDAQHLERTGAERAGVYRQLRQAVKLVINDNVITMAHDEKQVANASPEHQAEFRQRMGVVLVGGLALNFVLTIILAVAFNKRIVARLDVMIDNNLRLASQKELHAPLAGTDEIATLDSAFHTMAHELREAARKERAMVENARDVICSLDDKGTFISISNAALTVFGYRPDELLGSKLINIVAQESQADTLNHLKIVMDSEHEPPFEMRLRRKSGECVDLIWSATWSRDERTMFCVAHDITERKGAERLRQEVMQMVSHDLRTPLSAVRSFLEMLESGIFGPLSQRGMELLAVADRSCQRMLALVKDLLDIERMESGMLSLEKSDCALNTVFEQAIQGVQAAADFGRVRLIALPAKQHVYADRDRLAQILSNLLTNAIKFSPRDGEITLSAAEVPGFIEVRVADQGRGVPAELQETIFERFKQVQLSDATEKGGSGLGLAICRALVELHGGTIRVESEADKGSTFIFTLPA